MSITTEERLNMPKNSKLSFRFLKALVQKISISAKIKTSLASFEIDEIRFQSPRDEKILRIKAERKYSKTVIKTAAIIRYSIFVLK